MYIKTCGEMQFEINFVPMATKSTALKKKNNTTPSQVLWNYVATVLRGN